MRGRIGSCIYGGPQTLTQLGSGGGAAMVTPPDRCWSGSRWTFAVAALLATLLVAPGAGARARRSEPSRSSRLLPPRRVRAARHEPAVDRLRGRLREVGRPRGLFEAGSHRRHERSSARRDLPEGGCRHDLLRAASASDRRRDRRSGRRRLDRAGRRRVVCEGGRDNRLRDAVDRAERAPGLESSPRPGSRPTPRIAQTS